MQMLPSDGLACLTHPCLLGLVCTPSPARFNWFEAITHGYKCYKADWNKYLVSPFRPTKKGPTKRILVKIFILFSAIYAVFTVNMTKDLILRKNKIFR